MSIEGDQLDVLRAELAQIHAANCERVRAELDRLAMERRLRQREELRLALFRALLDDDVQVLQFDPDGDGRMVVVDGDLVSARNLAITVPGISNSLETFAGLMAASHRLRVRANDTAVITWLGYDTPVGVGLHPMRMLDEIGDDELARVGAVSLSTLVEELHVGRPDATISVIGHSYGSLVTGLAARLGMPANRVVFLGSPGVGVDHVSQFNLPDGARVYAASTGAREDSELTFRLGRVVKTFDRGALYDDYVTDIGEYLAPFGTVPTDPVFGARVVDIGAGVSVLRSHSQYFDDDSPALAFLVSVVNGDID